MRKVDWKFWIVYQCTLNVPLWKAKLHIDKYNVLQCSKLFCSKVSSRFLQQDLQNSYSFSKIQNVVGPELPEENLVFYWRKISYFVFTYIFPLVLLFSFWFETYYIYIYFSSESSRSPTVLDLAKIVWALRILSQKSSWNFLMKDFRTMENHLLVLFLWQDSQCSCSFGKIKNEVELEFSEEKF